MKQYTNKSTKKATKSLWLKDVCYVLNTRKRKILKFLEKDGDDLASRITRCHANHKDTVLTTDDLLLIIKYVPLDKAPNGAIRELLEMSVGM